MLHDSGQRRRLEPGTEVDGAKPTPSPFLCATITLESPVKLSLQAPKSSGPSTLFLLPFRSHFTLICRIGASHLVTSAFADLGVNLLWSDLQGIFQLGYSNYYLSAPPPSLSAYTFSNGSRTIYFGLHSRSNRGNLPWLAPSNADRQAHPSAAEQCAIASRILHLVLTQARHGGVPVGQSHRISSADFPIAWTPYGL
jgi:hypothetical protein